MIECCGTCNYSTNSTLVPKLYCHLTDELVESADNCGMYDNGSK